MVLESSNFSDLRVHPQALEVGLRVISIYGKNFHVYKDVDCETNSICSVQSSQVINSEMLICRMSCMEAGDMPLFIRISPSSRLGPLFISVILLPTITNVLPPSISQFNQTFSVFFDRPFFIKYESLVCAIGGTTFESQIVGYETVCSGQSLRPGSFDVIIAIVCRSCRFDVGGKIPIVISTLRPSSTLSVYPSLVPASEMVEFTVVGQWDLSPSNCV